MESAAFVDHGVSVTCHVTREGERSWWLTRESGMPPVECVDPGRCACLVGDVCSEDGSEDDSVCGAAHLVWKVDALEGATAVVFAALSEEAFDVFVSDVLPRSFRMDGRVVDAFALRQLVERLDDGWFSGGVGCGCSLDRSCPGCSDLQMSEWRFTRVDSYCGVKPDGKQGWFAGLSDAAGMVFHPGSFCGVSWLTCPESLQAD